MPAHRASSLASDRITVVRILCLAFFSVGWLAWIILRGVREMPGVEDLSAYPGGIGLILGALRVWESGASAVVSPQTRESLP